MKNFIFTLAALLFLCALNAQNDEPDLNELLSRLQQNHMGSIHDVFNEQELAVLKNHFQTNSSVTNTESVLVRRRGRATQSVAPLSVAEINPIDLTNIANLGVPSTLEFEGAGVTIVGNGRSIIIDNNNRVFLRGMGTGQYTDTGVNINTIPTEVITGIEVLSNGSMYGIGTNGSNSSHLYHIDPTNWNSTVIGGNNGLILPINLARNGADELVTVDIDNDFAYGINTTSGVVSLKGSIGFDANFGQGMGYDEISNEILLTAFNNQTFVSELRSLNFSTGLTTNLGTIVPGQTYQFGWVGWFDKDLLNTSETHLGQLRFYPNPTRNRVHVSAPVAIQEIAIFDMTGKLVHVEIVNATDIAISVSHLESGLYIVNARMEGLEVSQKLVVE